MPVFSKLHYRTSDGLTLVGDVSGDPRGPAVVLLHGGGQTRQSWSETMQRLVDSGYYVVCYDARGHGESDWSPSGDYTLQALAADLRSVCDTLQGPVALVGASMGGMTSFYAVGSQALARVQCLTLVDITLRPNTGGVDKILRFMTANDGGFADLEEAADAVAAFNPSRQRPPSAQGLLKNLRAREDGRLYWHWDPKTLMPTKHGSPTFVDELLAVSGNVDVPTLLVRGENSDVVDDEGVAELRRLVPQTQVLEVPHATHMVTGDQNTVFEGGIISFLTRHHSFQP